jgi:hypothetical protein
MIIRAKVLKKINQCLPKFILPLILLRLYKKILGEIKKMEIQILNSSPK